MLRERETGGAFKGPDDFARRVDAKAANKRILENLVRAGSFDWTGEHRAAHKVRAVIAVPA